MIKSGSKIGRVTKVIPRQTVKQSWHYEITDTEGTTYQHIGRKYIDIDLHLGQAVKFFVSDYGGVSLVREASHA